MTRKNPTAARETKLTFSNTEAGTVIHWLEHACMRDPQYEAGVVSSVYLDTKDLHHYDQKRNGDFLKSKVRIRWYDNDACFLEVKQKDGASRTKLRSRLDLGSGLSVERVLSQLDREIEEQLPALGYRRVGHLEPLLLIRYSRRRFVDPLTGARIAVDSDIESPWANLAMIPAHPPIRLAQGVLEVKHHANSVVSVEGMSPVKARPFAAVSPIGRSFVAGGFSKYAQCIEALVSPTERRE